MFLPFNIYISFCYPELYMFIHFTYIYIYIAHSLPFMNLLIKEMYGIICIFITLIIFFQNLLILIDKYK